MKKIIIIIICVIVLIGCGFAFMVYKDKPVKITLSQSQITENTKIVNELMNSLNDNNFNEYKSISAPVMGKESVFNDVKGVTNKDFGEYKSATFKEACKVKGREDLIYSMSFSKKSPVEAVITMNSNNKVEGIHF